MKRKADDNSCETARKRNRHRSFKEVMELIESQDGLLDIVQKLDVDDSQSWNIVSATMKLSKSELVGLKTHFNPKPSCKLICMKCC